jgi:phosphoribosyl 1,2-cyclic phosphodiesterase
MSNEFKVRFWGVRGSYPTPGAETVKYGGNTPRGQVLACKRNLTGLRSGMFLGTLRLLGERARVSGNAA